MAGQFIYSGGCQCGAVRYKISGLPKTLYCCHCTECQQQAASAFGMSLRLASSQLQIEGETASFIRDRGKTSEVECVFCPSCGTRLLHRRDASAVDISIKAGSLDRPLPFEPVGHIWTRSKLPWFKLPEEHLTFEKQPEDRYQRLVDAFYKRYGP